VEHAQAISGAQTLPHKPRPWYRISLVVQQVEGAPAKLFSIDRGPYSLRFNVALTKKLLRRLGWLFLAGLSLTHPGALKLLQWLLGVVQQLVR
jgi:hypothetical protein